MQTYFFSAGILVIVVGAIHSVLGEVLIFSRLRNKGFVPTIGEPLLRERNVRILWASWHIVTVLGWAFGAILLRLALSSDNSPFQLFVENTIIYAMLASSFLVLIGTKGMHPGWLGLLGVAILTWLG